MEGDHPIYRTKQYREAAKASPPNQTGQPIASSSSRRAVTSNLENHRQLPGRKAPLHSWISFGNAIHQNAGGIASRWRYCLVKSHHYAHKAIPKLQDLSIDLAFRCYIFGKQGPDSRSYPPIQMTMAVRDQLPANSFHVFHRKSICPAEYLAARCAIVRRLPSAPWYLRSCRAVLELR
jgi:hypothetical protein